MQKQEMPFYLIENNSFVVVTNVLKLSYKVHAYSC